MRPGLGERNESFQYFILTIPAVVLFAVFMIYPVIGGIFYSLTDWNGIDMRFHFIGLSNYKTFFHDFYVLIPLRNSFVFAFLLTICQNIVSLLIAIALHRRLKTKNLLRTLLFLPVLLSPLMVGYLWSYLFTDPIAELGKALHLQTMANNYLGSAAASLYAAVFVNVWRMLGWTMVVYIAALQGIPGELYEAAEMDGAVGWRKFIYITSPLIIPAFTVNLVMTMERGFKEFDLLFSLTGGGPGNASEIMSLTIYREAFQNYRAGYGATLGVILFLIIVAITLIQLNILRRMEDNAI
ncbi:carbohydrate ABC transporter permease [Paenibacillus humicola]|uniref:carbohydrate ABC transporter permease n=1 Tax=Paenibacillus humicola TaxID=3110540 RepID=UPI00237BF694|nr:sugar ABC transporter permease [Paenibacillus humicola]